jgi:hypothetical protein
MNYLRRNWTQQRHEGETRAFALPHNTTAVRIIPEMFRFRMTILLQMYKWLGGGRVAFYLSTAPHHCQGNYYLTRLVDDDGITRWCAWCAVHLLDYSMAGEILYWLNSSALSLCPTISPAHEYFSGASLCQNISACVRRWNPFWGLWSAWAARWYIISTTWCLGFFTFKCFWILYILRYKVKHFKSRNSTQ